MSQVEYTAQDFELVGIKEDQTDVLSQKTTSFWGQVFHTFARNKLALFSVALLAVIALLAIFVPMFWPISFSDQTGSYNTAPNATYLFGTDNLGRDVFVRVWVGARISLFIGLLAAGIDLVIGVLWGATAGVLGGRVDDVMMRIADVLTALPYLLVVVLVMVVLDKGLLPMIVALSLTGWVRMARIVRGEVLSIKNQEYVLASRTLGASTWHLIRRHLIPNALGGIIVTMTLSIPGAIFTESFLSYLGLGVTQPMASWGTMASEGNEALATAPWRLIFPALLISITIFAFNTIGDGLRDALDPKLRK